MKPNRPLTLTELEVADYIADGWNYARIADWLGIAEATVRSHVWHIADKIENPDNLKPYQAVFLWAAHRKWLAEHNTPNTDAA